MKITFNVEKVEKGNISNLMHDICAIECRINVNLKTGIINAEVSNSEYSHIDSVIDLINKYFDITEININNDINNLHTKNMSMTSSEKVNNSSYESTSNSIKLLDTKTETTNYNIKSEQIKSFNSDVEDSLTRLKKTCYWLLKEKNADTKTLCSHISSLKQELIYKHNNSIVVPNYTIGDIVQVNYGYNLPGELSGHSCLAIVANIRNNMPYLVPIFNKPYCNLNNMVVTSEREARFYYTHINKFGDLSNFRGFAILDKSQYLNERRILSIVGKCSDKFFCELIENLSNLSLSYKEVDIE